MASPEPDAALEGMARGLTAHMLMLIDTLGFGDWFSADEADTNGATCDALVRRGVLERRRDPHVWGRSQYRRTELGLTLHNIQWGVERHYLQSKDTSSHE